MRFSIPFHKFLEENNCCLAIAALGNIGFQHFALVVDGTPQIVCFTIDLHKDLIKMPSPVGIILRSIDPFLTDFTCEQWTEPVPPIADCFMADIDVSFMK